MNTEVKPYSSVYMIVKGSFVMYVTYNHETGRFSLSRNTCSKGSDYHFEDSKLGVLEDFVACSQEAINLIKQLNEK